MNTKIIKHIDYAPEGIDLSQLEKPNTPVEEMFSDEALAFDLADHPEVIEFIEKNTQDDIPTWAIDKTDASQYAFEELKKKK